MASQNLTTLQDNESIDTLASRVGVSKDILRTLNPTLNRIAPGESVNLPIQPTPTPVVPIKSTSGAQFGYDPQSNDLNKLKVGDSIIFNKNVGAQSPGVLSLINQGITKNVLDDKGNIIGVSLSSPYISPSAQSSLQNGSQNLQDILFNSPSDNLASLDVFREQQKQALLGGQSLLQAQAETARQQATQQFGQAIQETKDVSNRSRGSLSRILGRAGGFTTSAGGQAISAQESALQSNISKLEIAREQSMQQINNAEQSGNQTLLNTAFDNLYKIEKEISQNQQQRVQNFLAFQQQTSLDESRATTQAFDRLNFSIDTIGSSFFTSSPEEAQSLLEQAGFKNVDINTIASSLADKEEEARLASLPKPTIQTDPNGNMIQITYNADGTAKSIETILKKTTTPKAPGLATSNGFATSNIESSVRGDVVSLTQQINAGTTDLTTAFNNIRGLYSNAEVTDEAIQSVFNQSLGITSVGTDTIETDSTPAIYGTGNNKNISIEDAYKTTKGFGGNLEDHRKYLLQRGYTRADVQDVTATFTERFGESFYKFLGL